MESEEIQSRLLFPHIVELNLSSNQLSSLPPDIGELSSLKILSLTRNIKLKEVSFGFVLFNKFGNIYLYLLRIKFPFD